MRWFRLFLLGLASIYPLYWVAQFVLFFLPASLHALFFRLPLTIVDISYLQATALSGKSEALPLGFESLIFAALFSLIIWYLHGDTFLTGGLAIVLLGQSALLPFLNQLFWQGRLTTATISGLVASMGLICFGLYRILGRIGGADFVDRLALLSLLALLPQAMLWLAFRMNYPFFGTKFLLMLLAPLYLAALIAAALPHNLASNLANTLRSPVPLVEILASAAIACLLVAAIGLTTHYGERHHLIAAYAVPQIHSS
ncbi:MAG TPA: hypothetical protein VN025_19785 [Candidatus Dormibacteraeota bacterium]|jgi:hypothetical protein|nr:hypothetical protein [Candidatus Dormibacteraeota bacterium]